MWESARKILLPLAAVVIVGFIVIVISQTVQVVELAERVHPTLGTAVLWGLLALYAAGVLVPAVRLWMLPRPLKPPESDSGPEFERHLQRLRRRLSSNVRLAGAEADLSTREGIEKALAVLDAHAEAEVKRRASTVFLMTAISQSGRLDGLLVLIAQIRMVYRVAQIYYQRPALRDLLRLYANVAGTAFVVGELEESEVGDQLGAMLAGSITSVVGAVPGMQAVTALFVNSMVSGAASAFLTLRVGLIAKGYSAALVRPEKRTLRKGASAQAIKMLSGIVSKGAKVVWGSLVSSGRGRARSAMESFRELFRA